MSKVALCEVNGLLTNLLSNLAGKNGDEWAEILRRALRRQNPFALPHRKFEPAFSITGRRRENAEVLKEIETRFGLDSDVSELLSGSNVFNWADGLKRDIVVLSGHDLGFEDVVKLRHIYVRGEELGLELCYTGTPAFALLQQSEWLRGKRVYFAMEPVEESILGTGESWMRGQKYDLTLECITGRMGQDFRPEQLWAFQLPPKRN